MFESIKCLMKGHLFVDSRRQPGTQVCVRCRTRQPFEGLAAPATMESGPSPDPTGGAFPPNG